MIGQDGGCRHGGAALIGDHRAVDGHSRRQLRRRRGWQHAAHALITARYVVGHEGECCDAQDVIDSAVLQQSFDRCRPADRIRDGFSH